MFSSGMLVFFMLGGALRSAGDARTPMVLGIAMTRAEHRVERRAHSRARSDPAPSAPPARRWERAIASGARRRSTRSGEAAGAAAGSCRFPRGADSGRTGTIIRSLFRFGLPTRHSGHRDERRRRAACSSFIGSVHQSAAAQAAFAIWYSQLFSLITWTSDGLMGAAAAVAGQNLGAGKPDRVGRGGPCRGAHRRSPAPAFIGLFFLFLPRQLLAVFGMNEPVGRRRSASQLLRVLSVSGLLIAVALTYTGGLQGTGDTKSPLYISIVSQIIVPLGICFVIKHTARCEPIHIWIAILVGHAHALRAERRGDSIRANGATIAVKVAHSPK